MWLFVTGPRGAGNHAISHMLQAVGWQRFKAMADLRDGTVQWTPGAEAKLAGRWQSFAEQPPPMRDGWFLSGHVPPGLVPARTILILRDPRAIAVSWFRREAAVKHADSTARGFERFLRKLGRFILSTKPFFDAREKADLVLEYERLADEAQLEKLSQFIGRDARPGVAQLKPPISEPAKFFTAKSEALFWHTWEAHGVR